MNLEKSSSVPNYFMLKKHHHNKNNNKKSKKKKNPKNTQEKAKMEKTNPGWNQRKEIWAVEEENKQDTGGLGRKLK